MSSFMLQDWGSANDIQHYFMLLMQSALLAGAGFAMSYLLKENKGARIFFGLGLISVTANFTILGALVFSLTPYWLKFCALSGVRALGCDVSCDAGDDNCGCIAGDAAHHAIWLYGDVPARSRALDHGLFTDECLVTDPCPRYRTCWNACGTKPYCLCPL